MSTNYTINASGRTLGRVASEAAALLIGKNSPSFQRNEMAKQQVSITNAAKLRIPVRKMTEKQYIRYSGYPGGKRELSMRNIVERSGFSEVLRIAVEGMLPKNNTRKKLMKYLTIKD